MKTLKTFKVKKTYLTYDCMGRTYRTESMTLEGYTKKEVREAFTKLTGLKNPVVTEV